MMIQALKALAVLYGFLFILKLCSVIALNLGIYTIETGWNI